TQGFQRHRARTELIGEPGGDAADPQGRGQASDQIGVAAGTGRGGGRATRRRGGRGRSRVDHGGRGFGGHRQRRQLGLGVQGGGAFLGQTLFFHQAAAATLGHRLVRRGQGRGLPFEGGLVG